ncbi:beta-N-acetylhexosaminidase [Aestuariimicrobium sp. Y1814]|uniref:beta-N-acetylhexosaminidase n=1 Tax=Aestuariimicrobium sp. Y1814 TaxID=3418742 RepID=UPI003DA71915
MQQSPYPLGWSISGSADGVAWTEIQPESAGPANQGDWTTWTGSVEGFRYIKVTTHGRSAPWGTALWELQVFGTLDGPIIEPEEPFRSTVVPAPASVTEGTEGDYVLTSDAAIVATGDAIATANQLAETLRTSTGFELPVTATGQGITLAIDAEITEPEGYVLTATADGVEVRAGAQAGLFYGAQSVLQLLGPWAHSPETVAVDWTVPGITVTDAPRYEWRGFMLDSSRSFYPVAEVKQMIDQMAQYKLNVLHMHFADDQGWRIAISNEGRVEGDTIDYSLLTSVSGGTAVATTNWTDLPGRTGFYTADDFAEIIAYADSKHIAIVPEVDGPAHSNAMLHALPELNTAGSFSGLPAAQRDGTVAAPVNTTTSVGESSLDPGSEVTYTVLTHVLQQIVAQNSSLVAGERYLHIGGDESHNTGAEPYRTYMQRTGEIVTSLDAIPVVWNEAAGTAPEQLPDGTIVQHWAGDTASARNFVNNHDGRALVSPASRAYLPQVPGTGITGPSWACGGGCGINAFYDWNPLTFMGLTSDDQVVGVEAPIWSEHLRSLGSAEFLMYPRLMATAEVAWSPQAVKDIDNFRERLVDVATSLTSQGRNFYYGDATWGADLAALVHEGLTEDDDAVEVAVAAIPATLLADVSAVLTLNGSDVPLEVSVDRPFQLDTGKFDGRQVNGLFRFTLADSLPEGDYTGTLTVTADGETLTTDVALAIGEGTGIEPTPTPSTTVTVTAEPTATATATVTATATSTSTATVTATATATVTTTPTETTTVDVTETATSTATATRTVTAPPTTATGEPTTSPTSEPTSAPTSDGPVDLYTTPGYHNVNGREWFTECEPYSQTTRCRTDIWASQVRVVDGEPRWVHGWAFNNLTYLPLDRSVWGDNPLANNTAWTAEDGREWYTECDTATTGANGCRSHIWSTVWEATSPGAATFHQVDKWVFNNMVRFK